jgi:hypothetical protein
MLRAPVARHNYVHRNSLTFAQLLARLQAMREAFRTVAALRSALSTRGNLLSSFLPCAISWVYSRVRIDASARLTVYSGCACDGSGPGGGRLSCWSRRPRSPVGIVKGSVDAGGVVRGGGRDGHASICNFESSLGAWPRRTVSAALRGSMASG